MDARAEQATILPRRAGTHYRVMRRAEARQNGMPSRLEPGGQAKAERARQAVIEERWADAGWYLGAYSKLGGAKWPARVVLERGIRVFELDEEPLMGMLCWAVHQRAGTLAALSFLGRCWQDRERRRKYGK